MPIDHCVERKIIMCVSTTNFTFGVRVLWAVSKIAAQSLEPELGDIDSHGR